MQCVFGNQSFSSFESWQLKTQEQLRFFGEKINEMEHQSEQKGNEVHLQRLSF